MAEDVVVDFRMGLGVLLGIADQWLVGLALVLRFLAVNAFQAAVFGPVES